METIIIAVGSALLYLIAYNTYGKYLSKKIFNLDKHATTPANTINDGVDYVPTSKEVLFGHHYTSIAGTGPIVGPAIGIIWGWVPALIWVIFGSIFMGAVHDFGAIIVSIRNEGKSVGDIAASLISKRVRMMFLLIIFLTLMIVIAIFCLVIAILFEKFPQSVIPIWVEIPIAIWLGNLIYKKNKNALKYSLIALVILYISVIIGAYFPIKMPEDLFLPPKVLWAIILLIYAFIASTLPVWKLLQPRDYINGHELFVAMILLALGVLFAHPTIVAPAYNPTPEGAPSMLPFLFITIACGAISGFHSLVGSGTTSKQLANEKDACPIGYGGMLLEGMLAVFAIIAVSAGIGLASQNTDISGVEAWTKHYESWGAAKGLGAKVGAFVNGSSLMLERLGIPFNIAISIMGVFVASFAGTTLDTATRLQRYAISEISESIHFNFFKGKYAATSFAVISGGALALWDGKGTGGLLLWPLFGTTNQLLACLALLIITVYLANRKKPIAITAIPFCFMFVVATWSMYYQITDSLSKNQWHLLIIGAIIVALELWMIVEAFLVIKKKWNKS